jgi:hypothetical protein
MALSCVWDNKDENETDEANMKNNGKKGTNQRNLSIFSLWGPKMKVGIIYLRIRSPLEFE